MPGPLNGVKVVEFGQLLAGPFCGQLLADYGATVVKVEQPGLGDPLRAWGREKVGGESLWWPIAGRNKLSVTCNLRTEEGQAIARRLVSECDVLIENFRPGTLERWNLGWDELSEQNPSLVMVRVSGFGQTGPYASRPGYASVGEAMGGLRHVVGDPSNPPSRTGISIGDSLAAMFAALGALTALHHARQSGQGQVVDVAIYESVLAVMESLIPEYVLGNFIRERTGSILPNVAPSNIYPTLDDGWVIIAANQDTLFHRLCEAMGRKELADDPKFVGHAARGENQAELDSLIADWTKTQTTEELLRLLNEAEVANGKIFRAPEMLSDPHFLARDAITEVTHPVFGKFPMQNIFPRFSETQPVIKWAGPDLGAHNEEVLGGWLGISAEERSRLAGAGII